MKVDERNIGFKIEHPQVKYTADQKDQLNMTVCTVCQRDLSSTSSSFSSRATSVLSLLGIVYVTHGLMWAQFTLPFVYVVTLPMVLIYKLFHFRKKASITDDISCVVNLTVFTSLWLRFDARVFQVLFSLANGPTLLGAVHAPDSLVLQDPDGMTSIYLNLAPAVIMFCIRWYTPYSFWPIDWWEDHLTLMNLPDYNIVWCYAVPFAIYILYMILLLCFSKLVTIHYLDTMPSSRISHDSESCPEQTTSHVTWTGILAHLQTRLIEGLVLLLVPLMVYDNLKFHSLTLFTIFLVVAFKGGVSSRPIKPEGIKIVH